MSDRAIEAWGQAMIDSLNRMEAMVRQIDPIAAPYVIQTLDPLCGCSIQDGGCAGHPLQFIVNGPDGVPVGRLYASEQEAEDYASDLNAAYRAGILAATNPHVPSLWRRS